MFKQKKSNQNDFNILLFKAISGSRLDYVKEIIKRGANVNSMFSGQTVLHEAVKKGKYKIVKLLLDKGADICLVNKNFDSAIELAAQQNRYNILKLLLLRRKTFNRKVFQGYVNYCYDNYANKAGEEADRHNYSMMAHFASRLSGANVYKLLADKKERNPEKYIVQLYSFQTKEKSLNGWQVEKFLPIRIYSFFEILIKLKRGIIKPYSASIDVQMKLIEQLEQEILLSIELLRTVHDRLAILQYNDLDEEIDDQEDLLPKNKRIDLLYGALAEYICETVFLLQPGKSYNISIGFIDHECTLSIISHQGYILGRIDNLGFGVKKHEPKVNSDQEEELIFPFKYPFKLFSMRQSNNIPGKKALISYLKNVFIIKDREYGKFENTYTYTKLNEIYGDKSSVRKYSEFKGGWPQIALKHIQTTENCVMESQQWGLMMRSYEKKFFTWLTMKETVCVVDKVRILCSKNLCEEEYWEMRNTKNKTFTKGKLVKYCKYTKFDSNFMEIIFEVLVLDCLSQEPLNSYQRLYISPYLKATKRSASSKGSFARIYNRKPKLTTLVEFLQQCCAGIPNRVNDIIAEMLTWLYLGKHYDLRESLERSLVVFKDSKSFDIQNKLFIIASLSLSLNNSTNDRELYDKAMSYLNKCQSTGTHAVGLIKGIIQGNLAISQSEPNKHYAAMQCLREVASKSNNQRVRLLAWYNLAVSHHYLGNINEAKKAYNNCGNLQVILFKESNYLIKFKKVWKYIFLDMSRNQGLLNIIDKNLELAEGLFIKCKKITEPKVHFLDALGLGMVYKECMLLRPETLERVEEYHKKALHYLQIAISVKPSDNYIQFQLQSLKEEYNRLIQHTKQIATQTSSPVMQSVASQTPNSRESEHVGKKRKREATKKDNEEVEIDHPKKRYKCACM